MSSSDGSDRHQSRPKVPAEYWQYGEILVLMDAKSAKPLIVKIMKRLTKSVTLQFIAVVSVLETESCANRGTSAVSGPCHHILKIWHSNAERQDIANVVPWEWTEDNVKDIDIRNQPQTIHQYLAVTQGATESVHDDYKMFSRECLAFAYFQSKAAGSHQSKSTGVGCIHPSVTAYGTLRLTKDYGSYEPFALLLSCPEYPNARMMVNAQEISSDNALKSLHNWIEQTLKDGIVIPGNVLWKHVALILPNYEEFTFIAFPHCQVARGGINENGERDYGATPKGLRTAHEGTEDMLKEIDEELQRRRDGIPEISAVADDPEEEHAAQVNDDGGPSRQLRRVRATLNLRIHPFSVECNSATSV